MKRLLVALSFLILFASVVPQSYALAPFVSWWNAEDADNGFGVGLRRTVFAAPFISIEPRVSWLHFSEGDGVNMFPIEVAALARISIVYGGAGAGFYIVTDDVKDKLGWFALVGVELELSSFGVFGEFKYTGVKTELSDYPEIEVDMSGPSVNVGVKLRL